MCYFVRTIQSLNYIIMKLAILLTLLILIPPILPYLCSAYCGPASCSGTTTNSCQTSCPLNWILSGSVCQPDPASGYTLMATSTDLGGSIQIAPSTTTSCGVYTYFGNNTCTSNFAITLATGITVPHYSIEISLWVLLTDASKWQNSKQITIAEGVNSMQYTLGSTPSDY